MKILVALFISVLVITAFAGASLVPPQFPNTVVALGSMKPIVLPGQPCIMQWTTEGTGFLYGYLMQSDPDPTKRLYDVYLVTARHVIEEHAAAQAFSKVGQAQTAQMGACTTTTASDDSISVRMNPNNPSLPGQEFDLATKDWFFHPNKGVDIAAVRLNAPSLKTRGLLDTFIPNDQAVAGKAKLKSIGAAAGDGVFVLGFPMNLAGVQRNYVIVRQGCVARISDMLDGASLSYLVDAFVFPGNSGSPVILRPEATSITGTPPQTNAFLIGVITSYQPYTDIAYSPQTKRPRISFEENSGLAEVLPTDYIDEAISAWLKTIQPKQ